jgi:hypothetical protein
MDAGFLIGFSSSAYASTRRAAEALVMWQKEGQQNLK